MLSPELAKRLTAAGFTGASDTPEMSEIIVACGADFGAVEATQPILVNPDGTNKFVSRMVVMEGKFQYVEIVPETYAPTPDDSVALLWLYLKNK